MTQQVGEREREEREREKERKEEKRAKETGMRPQRVHGVNRAGDDGCCGSSHVVRSTSVRLSALPHEGIPPTPLSAMVWDGVGLAVRVS